MRQAVAISGLDQEVKAFVSDMLAKQDRLDRCPKHEFVQVKERGRLKARYRCLVCDEEISETFYKWYVRGLRDAKRRGRPRKTKRFFSEEK